MARVPQVAGLDVLALSVSNAVSDTLGVQLML